MTGDDRLNRPRDDTHRLIRSESVNQLAVWIRARVADEVVDLIDAEVADPIWVNLGNVISQTCDTFVQDAFDD